MKTKLIQVENYLLLIDEEAEIKEGDSLLLNNEHPQGRVRKCYHLTNDNKLWNGKDWDTLTGKHYFIDPKESESWGFVTELECKKIIAYYPLIKEAKELDLPLLPNPFEDKNETSQEGFDEQLWENYRKPLNRSMSHLEREAFIKGYKASQKSDKQFSLEDVKKAIEIAQSVKDYKPYSEEEIIQSLSTQQLPKEFVPSMKCGRCYMPDGDVEGCWSAKECSRGCDYPNIIQTITNSEGKEELVGEYKY